MDPEAARRARRRAIRDDLVKAYTDEEACPPEWLDLAAQLDRDTADLRERVEAESRRFASEGDIQAALRTRDRVAAEIRGRVDEHNRLARRLNLIAPLPRFHRAVLDAGDEVKPLYRVRRAI